ncbi:MAG TPA: NAD(P)-dependent oxidoreductase [Candidatus Limnocylindrales bacterium]|nr:NAD(P)-dependent oxidoreductase [Candidatus Limnocylindrales bacterium]
MTTSIAFLGLGTMGGPMAANLAKSGFEVRGWNRTPDRPSALSAREAGVRLVSPIAEAVAGADIVAICVSDVDDVDEVLFSDGGAAACAVSGTLVIDFSTIGPVAARGFATRLAAEGLRYVDAPVTGGDVGARAGTLTIMAGGDKADFDAAASVFGAVGRIAKHCGPAGSGQAVKLCNQVLGALHMVALTEAIALARMQKIDPALVVDVCASGAAGSWALANLGPKVLARDFAPGFMIKHLVKDLRLVLETPPGEGLDALRGTMLAKSLLEKVMSLGGSDLGTQSLTLAYEEHPDFAID